ncbi:MAG: anti-sigma factor [Acidimicrobiales bacterium]
MTNHCEDELPLLLAGELDREATIETARHLRDCATCTQQLIGISIAHGSLNAARRVDKEFGVAFAPESTHSAVTSGHPVDQPPLRVDPKRDRRRKWEVAAAALLVVVVGVGVGLGVRFHRSATPPLSAVATLHHLAAPASASGAVTVRLIGQTEHMNVTTAGLPTVSNNEFYEVWLLQPATNKMLAVGLLSPSGKGTFSVAAPIMAQYSSVDISLQSNDGDPAHSKTSVLRGPVTSA